MIPLAVGQINSVLAGQLTPDAAELVVSGTVQTDSRLVQPGDIFFALIGEEMDGHDFVEKAVAQGAALIIVNHSMNISVPHIIVDNTLTALHQLATHVLAEVRKVGKIRVVAVTGSNGKTTTKNMLHAMLQQFGNTVAPIESFNNEVGAPLTVLRIGFDTEFLVSEQGASAAGEIALLSTIAPPDIAIILKVGLAHLGDFGGVRDTQQAKAEMVRPLTKDQVVILNRDDAMVWEMRDWTKAKIVSFSAGGNASADYVVNDIDLSLAGTAFQFSSPDGNGEGNNGNDTVRLQILGDHHVNNALAAIAAVDALGLDRNLAISALEQMPRAERWRMEILEREDGVTIINDAYNASPDSAAAALKTLAYLSRLHNRRSVAVFGEMADLGAEASEEHRKLGILAVRLNINQLYVIGEAAKSLHNSTSFEGSWDGESKFFETIADAEAALVTDLQPGDLVLVKSSKSANIRFLGDRLAGIKE